MQNWEVQISGKLTVDDYRQLTDVMTKYIAQIDAAKNLGKELMAYIGNNLRETDEVKIPWWKKILRTS